MPIPARPPSRPMSADSVRNWPRCARRTQGPPKPDLRAPFEHRDDHHVRDPDATDQECDCAEAEEERGV